MLTWPATIDVVFIEYVFTNASPKMPTCVGVDIPESLLLVT